MKFSLVPRERRFYELFRRQGELVSQTLDELSKSMLEGRSRHPRLRDLEHQCDEVTREIYELINRTFVAPFDQEDIISLASSLDDIVDLAEEIGDKMELYHVGEITPSARAMGETLADAGAALSRALDEIEGFAQLDRYRIKVHEHENEGDRLYREAVAELFSVDRPAVELVKWKDIYDLLEQSLDRCEKTVNLLSTISIKNA
ncbi:MAG TPA: DUF47 family protein [Candidatus Dormibacteraeota bacterium]|jgi:hypothetical protein|nr:DUF47 family protein [Candidatus Dormibacteraeota bacterium]